MIDYEAPAWMNNITPGDVKRTISDELVINTAEYWGIPHTRYAEWGRWLTLLIEQARREEDEKLSSENTDVR